MSLIPCKFYIKDKEFTYDEFREYLLNGGLGELLPGYKLKGYTPIEKKKLNAKKREDEKIKKQDINDVLSENPETPEEEILQFFLAGNKINESDFLLATGYREGSTEHKQGIGFPFYKYGFATKEENPKNSLDVLYESLSTLQKISEGGAMDIHNIIGEILRRYPTKGKMLERLLEIKAEKEGKDSFEQYIPDDWVAPVEEEMLSEIEPNIPDVLVDILRDKNIDIESINSAQELRALVDARKEDFNDSFPYMKKEYEEVMKYIDDYEKGLSKDKERFSEAVSKNIEEERLQSKEKGRLEGELDEKIAAINSKIADVTKERQRKLDSLNNKNELDLGVSKSDELDLQMSNSISEGEMKKLLSPFDNKIAELKREAELLESQRESTIKADRAQTGLFDNTNNTKKTKNPRVPESPIFNTGKTKKLNEILSDLAKQLGQRIRYGKGWRNRSAGSYNSSNSLLLIKRANDIDVASHEMGHMLDDVYGFLKNDTQGKTNKELTTLSEHGSSPPKGSQDPDTYRLREGIAEFIRALIVNPEKTKTDFPETYNHYESVIPKEIKGIIESFSNEYRKIMGTSAHEKTMANIQEKIQRDGFFRNILNYFKKGTFKEQYINQLFKSENGFRLALDLQGIKDILPSKDFTKLQRLLFGHDVVFNDVLENGMITPDFKTVIDKKTNQAKTWKWIFEPASKHLDPKEIIRKASSYLISKRVEYLYNRDIKRMLLSDITKGILPSDKMLLEYPEIMDEVVKNLEGEEVTIKDIIEDLKSKGVEVAEDSRYDISSKTYTGVGLNENDIDVAKRRMQEHKSYSKEEQDAVTEIARRYESWADDNLRYLVKTGRLSIEQYDIIKENNAEYVALQRIAEAEPGEPLDILTKNKKGGVSDVKNIIYKYKGSTKTIIDPFQSLMEATYNSIKEGNRNRAMKAFRDVLIPKDRNFSEGERVKISDIGYQVKSKNSSPNTVTIFIDGKPEYWVFDKDIHESLKGINDLSHSIPEIFTIYGTLLRNSVTTFPVFQARNRTRDFLNRIIISAGTLGIKDYSKRKEFKRLYRIAGGGQFGYYLKDKIAYSEKQETVLKELIGDKNTVILSPGKVAKELSKLYMRVLGNSEEKTRLEEVSSVYRKMKKQGMSDLDATIEAVFQARDLLDFKVIGTKMKGINAIFPFTNAKIRGIDKLYRSVKRDPVLFSARFLTYAVLPQVVNSLIIKNSDDETKKEYVNLSPYRRDLFFNIPAPEWLGVKWITIPKPFEIGLMASLVGRYVDQAMLGDEFKVDAAYLGFLGTALTPIDPSVFTGANNPLIDVISNYDKFRGKEIIPLQEVDKDIAIRNTQRGSRIGKGIQWVSGNTLDSRQVDYIIKNTFSYYGDLGLRLSNIGRKDVSTKFDASISGFAKESSPSSSRDVVYVKDKMKALGLVDMYGQSPYIPEYNYLNDLIYLYFKETDKKEKQKIQNNIYDISKELKDFLDKNYNKIRDNQKERLNIKNNQ